jgi:entericidin B
LRLDVEPQLRGAAGRRRANPSGEPGNGCGCCGERALRGRAADQLNLTEAEMKNVMRFLLLAVAVGFFLSGCNTVHGLGKDIEKGGEAIQKAVK